MQFVIMGFDGPNMLEKRMSVRPRHLANIARMQEKAKVVIGGGMLDDEGKLKGSVLVLDVEDKAELDDYLTNEPYYTEHVWQEVRIEPYKAVVVDNKSV